MYITDCTDYLISTPTAPRLAAIVLNDMNGRTFELQVNTSFSIESYLVVDSVTLIESVGTTTTSTSRAMNFTTTISSGTSYEGTAVLASLVMQIGLADDGANFTVLVRFHAADTPTFTATVSSAGTIFSYYTFFGSALHFIVQYISLLIVELLYSTNSTCVHTK